ncbi:hypothetical protein PV328_010033 [Microctonus aethiopoides]|uniref:Uncharacterized protein n=1 Tax=Microctonus aethiopoides TaxID=144406 RepID=A0AA39C786_9HYME|nr:hypothetical protein PV328_010033 [Microctonus aethiopoides]
MLETKWIICVTIIYLYFACYCEVQSDNSLNVKNNKKLIIGPEVALPHHYVKEIRPALPNGGPVVVDFNSWTETRLELPEDIFEDGDDYVTLPPEFFHNIWQPDPYFLNAKVSEIATLTQKFSSVTLFRNKTVTYSARMHAIVACQMEFQLYPMDIQICPIYIESYLSDRNFIAVSYNIKKLRLRWGDSGLTVNPELKLLQYNFGKPELLEEINTYMLEKHGNFSRLVVYFRFERQIGHHLIQTFAPSTLVVMLSWFSFWLGLDAIPGRVTLLVTSMLTLVTMFTGLKTDIPPVAYVKALDLWMAGCMVFVFAALGEFVVVKVLDVRRQELPGTPIVYPRHCTTRVASMDKSTSVWDYESMFASQLGKNRAGSKHLLQTTWLDPEMLMQSKKSLSKQIDYYSRVIFPSLFLLFITLYWPIVLLKKTG